MANDLQIEMSNPVAGLGTFSYTVPGTDGIQEVTDITTVADSSGSLNNTFFHVYSALDETHYAVWYNINGAGVAPSVPGATLVEVTGVTNATANAIAQSTRTALAAFPLSFTITGATNHVIITNVNTGASTDASNGSASPGFSYSITQGVTASPVDLPVTVDVQSQLQLGSNLQIDIQKNGSTVVSNGGDSDNPSPTQFSIGATAYLSVEGGDVISVVLSSANIVDSKPLGVKSQINLFRSF